MVVLFDEGEVINSSNGLKNLGIVGEEAAITIGQNTPFFEVGKGMFDHDSAASKFSISSLLGSR